MPIIAQLLFDHAVNGIRQQGKRAVDEKGLCQYRAPDGCKCAFGQVLPDELYDTRTENKFSYTVISTFAGLEELKSYDDLLGDLQAAHDRAGFSDCSLGHKELSALTIEKQEELVEESFSHVANKHGLKYTKQPWNRVK